jgi:hypothetical protein
VITLSLVAALKNNKGNDPTEDNNDPGDSVTSFNYLEKTKYQGITYYWTNTQVRPYTGRFNGSKQ